MRTLELHASPGQVQRSDGRGAVRSAAYRSASRLYDERTGLWHDYTKKQGVEFSRVYTPKGAPDWAADRSKLWNAVEAKENRKNSMTAREWIVAFPHEFNAMQRRETGENIVREIMQRTGAAVDLCYHLPDEDGDRRNFHGHFLYTTRGFDERTADGWAKAKYRNFSHDKIEADGQQVSRASAEVNHMRAFIAGEMNRIAARDGLEVHTEHLSFEERGVEREPTKKMGPAATDMERKGISTARGDINREIRAVNDNRAEIKKLLAEKKIIDLAIARKKRELAGAKQKKAQGQKPQPAPANDRQPQAGKPDREAALLAARDAAAAQVSEMGGFWSRLFRRQEFETACTRKQEAEKALSDYRAAEAQTKAAGQLKQQERKLQEANRLAKEKAQAAAAARERTLEENKGFFRRTQSLQVAAVMAEIENAKAAAQLFLRRAGEARRDGQEQAERIASLQLAFKNVESREAPQPADRPEAGQGIGRLREEYRRTLREPGTGQESQPPTGEQQQPGGGIGTLRQDLPQRAAPDPAPGIGTLRAEYRQQLAGHQERQQTAGETASPDAGKSRTPDASQHVDLD